MAGPWDIKLPPPPPPIQPVHPVRPGAAIKDRDDGARRQRREQEQGQKHETPRDDDQPRIDDYA